MTKPHPLAHLEKSNYFYNRGRDTTRLEGFIDAAFAFALTLLVISFDAVPTSYDELITALKAVPAFLFGFLILGMFWIAHRNWSIRYGLDTTFSILVSLALVFILLVYVYPLRAMATAAIHGMTNGWVPSEFSIQTPEQARGLFVIYGVGFVTSNLCVVLLYWHAARQTAQIHLTAEERFITWGDVVAWSMVGSVGLVSIVLALTVPADYIPVAGWCYGLLGIAMPLFGVVISKRFEARFPDAEPDA
ncbi:MAG: TMEM175 family protein [Pseudomonadota bacterium]